MKNSNEFDKFANNYRELHTKNVQDVSGESSNYFSEYKIKELCHVFSAKQLINKILKSGFMSRGVLHYTIFMPRKGLFHKMIFLEKKLFWLPLGGQYYYISEK